MRRAATVSVTSTTTVRVTVTVRSLRVGVTPAERVGAAPVVRVEAREAERLREDDAGAGAAEGAAGAWSSDSEPLSEPPLDDDLVTVLPSAETMTKVDWLTEQGLSTVLGLDEDRPAPYLGGQRARARTDALGERAFGVGEDGVLALDRPAVAVAEDVGGEGGRRSPGGLGVGLDAHDRAVLVELPRQKTRLARFHSPLCSPACSSRSTRTRPCPRRARRPGS